MTNPLRGEVPLKVGDQTYTLVLSWNGLCHLEEATGKSALEVIAEMAVMQADPKRMRYTVLRTLLWSALIEHHPTLSVEDAGRIAGAVGVGKVSGALAKAMGAAFTKAAAAPEGGGDPLAEKAEGGTPKPS